MKGRQSIEMPIKPGYSVTLVGEDGVLLEDTLSRHVPEMGLVEFVHSDVKMNEFTNMVEECKAIHIVKEE